MFGISPCRNRNLANLVDVPATYNQATPSMVQDSEDSLWTDLSLAKPLKSMT